MELDEIANRIRNISQLERLEQQPAAPYDPAEAMENLEEAKNYIRFLYAQLMEQKEAYRRVLSALDEIKEDQKETRKLAKAESERSAKLLETIAAQTGDLKDANTKKLEQARMIETLSSRLNIANKERYGTPKSQKGIKSKPQPKGENDVRDDFDGANPAAQEEPVEKSKHAVTAKSEQTVTTKSEQTVTAKTAMLLHSVICNRHNCNEYYDYNK